MYDGVTISSYRSIRRVELSKLSRVNFFVGANNSGKSSFLEAIYLLCSPLNLQSCLAVLGNRTNGLKASQRSIVSSAAWLFHKRNLESKVSIAGIIDKTTYTTGYSLKDYSQSVGSKITFSSEQSVEIGKLTMTFSDGSKGNPQLREHLFTTSQGISLPNSSFPPLQAAALINSHWHSDQMNGVREFSFALKNGFTAECIELIREFDNNIRDVKIILDDDGQPELFVDSKEMGLYPISLLGDGYKRLFLSSIVMAQVKNGCMMMDEFDSGIHYKVLLRYLEWLIQTSAKYGIQLFLSTHSMDVLEIIAGLSADNLQAISVHRISRDREETRVHTVDGPSVRDTINELGVDLR